MSMFDQTHDNLKHFSCADLKSRKRLFWLFQVGVNKQTLRVFRALLRSSWLLVPLKRFLKPFCGGDSLQDCKQTIESLKSYSITTTLDYCMEATRPSYDHPQKTLKELHRALDYAASNAQSVPYVVLKMTALCLPEILIKRQQKEKLSWQEDVLWQQLQKDLLELCDRLVQTEVTLLVDAEESWIQGAIDELVESMMMRYNTAKRAYIYHTVQMYRKGRLAYLEKLYDLAKSHGFCVGIKLVRGAYLEKERAYALAHSLEEVICASKEETNRQFDAAMIYCYKHKEYIRLYLGTHNEASLEMFMEHVKGEDLADSVCFSQLLGMGDHITYTLAHMGLNVSKYVPYGAFMYLIPYMMRRAEENSSLHAQGKREYQLLCKEYRRRCR